MDQRTTIFLVRHGETEWNATGRYQGHLDSPLTPRGMAQAEALGECLAAIPQIIDTVFVSPLGRARETVEIIARNGLLPQAQSDQRLMEVTAGAWDGLTQEDIDAQWPDALNGATPFDWYFRSPDGESYDAARVRALSWLNDVRGTVIAVSHGLIGRIIRGAYLNLPKEHGLSLPVPQDVVWKLAGGEIVALQV